MKINKENYLLILINIILFSLFLRFIYVAISSYFENALFAGGDAYGLFLRSLSFGNNSEIPDIVNPLTFFYYFFGKLYFYTFDNYFWAGTISIFFWLIGYIFFFKIMILLKFDKSSIVYASVIYAFLPSALIITSTPLREVFQLLFVNFLSYIFLVSMITKKLNFINLILFIIITLFMYILHKVFLVFSFFLISFLLCLLMYSSFQKIKLKVIYQPMIIIILLFILGSSYFIFIEYFSNVGFSQLKNGLPYAIEKYQNGLILSAPEARGNYRTSISLNSYFDLFLFIPFNFFQYLFEPLFSINKISSIKDVVAVCENLLRLSLIILFFYKLNFKNKNLLGLFILYLIIELLWSFGTSNWGTALRHHVPSIGLLLICSLKNNNDNVFSYKYNEKK